MIEEASVMGKKNEAVRILKVCVSNAKNKIIKIMFTEESKDV